MTTKQQEVLAQAADRYAKEAGSIQEYFKQRGVNARKAKLGVVTNPITGHEAYKDMLSIPYYAPDGTCVAIRFKCMKQHSCEQYEHSRYNDLPGSTVRIYNTAAVLDTTTDTIAVAEGELDTLVLLNAVGIQAVGVAGVQNWRQEYSRIFEDYTNVLIFGDGDKEGKQFTDTIARGL